MFKNGFNAVLIETLWNVNFGEYSILRVDGFVLIETLWNVNTITLREKNFLDVVLIETLWNVNWKGLLFLFRRYLCINRNIVECK